MEAKKKQNNQKNTNTKKNETKTEKDVKSLFETSPSNEKGIHKKKKVDHDLIAEIEKTLKINVNKIVQEQTKIKEVENELKIIEKEKYKGTIYLLIGFLLLCLVLMVYTINNTNTRVKDLEKAIKKEITVTEYVSPTTIFFGDSITYRYDLNKYYNDANYLNKGVGGYQSSNVVETLYERVLQFHPRQAVLLIGVNDIMENKSNDQIITNIENIISKLKINNKNTKLFIESILPINDSNDDKIDHEVIANRTNDRIKEINELIKKLCAKEKITYIDAYKDMIDSDGRLNLEYTNEGLHLSESGYQKLTSILKEYLKTDK